MPTAPRVTHPDSELAVEEIRDRATVLMALLYSAGQICSNGTRVFVHRSLKERFLARLTERLEGVVMGDPLDEAGSGTRVIRIVEEVLG